MNASRTAAIVVGVNLIAVWVAAAAGGLVAQPVPASVPAGVAADQAVEEASSLLTAAAGRLEALARRRETAVPVARNPFHFGGTAALAARNAAASSGAARPAEPDPGEAAAQAPAFDVVLQGMAESRDGDTVVRTAILKAGGELVLATVGMAIGGRFQVVAIAADSVELEDLVDHSRRTCRMK
jgi:hypothetical protein